MAVLSVGFRPFYLLGAAFAAVGLPLWHFAPADLLPAEPYLAGPAWHAHEMVFGFAAAVMTGFLLTAARAWTGLGTLAGRWLAGLALLWVAGRVLIATGPAVPAIVVDCLFLPCVSLAVALPDRQGAQPSEPPGGAGAGDARRGQPAVSPGPGGPDRAGTGERRRAARPRSLRAAGHADGGAGDPGLHPERGADGTPAAQRRRGGRRPSPRLPSS